MSLSVTQNTVTVQGNGATVNFNYGFLMDSAAHVVALYTDPTGIASDVSAAVQATITGVGNPAGGTFSYQPGGAPMPVGSTLTLYRIVPYVQGTTLQNQGNLWPTVIETALDYLTMAVQQIAQQLTRMPLLPPNLDATLYTMTMPTPVANAAIGWDVTGKRLTNLVSLSGIGITVFGSQLITTANAAGARALLDAVSISTNENITGNKTFTGASTFTGSTAITGALTLNGTISPAQLVANTNNWAPAGFDTANTIRFSTDARRNITGITAGVDGRMVTLHNIGTFPAVFKFQDAGSNAANRFAFGGTIGGGQSAIIMYDATTQLWRAVHWPKIIGEIVDCASGVVPEDCLAVEADYSRATYAALFNEIGITFGPGDGATTFGVRGFAGAALIGAGNGTITESIPNANLNTGTDNATVPANNDKWITGMQCTWNTAGGNPTTSPANLLNNGVTVFVVRNGTTGVKFATTLANAIAGSVIDITAAGAGTYTLSYALSARTLGDRMGQEAHNQGSTEIRDHSHFVAADNGGDAGSGIQGTADGGTLGGRSTQGTSVGGTSANSNVMQPGTVVTRAIRYC